MTTILMPTKRAHIKRHVHHKLARRIKLYLFISLAMIGIVVYEVITTGLNPFIALGLGIGGIVIGFFLSRMFQIFWDKKEQIITSRIDKIGWILLWLYMVFSLSRHFLISYFVQASFVSAITFSIVAGVMIGRFLGIRKTVMRILRKQEII